MRKLLVHVLIYSLVFVFPGGLSAEGWTWIGQRGEKKWQSHVEATLGAGDDDRYGIELDPFIPIVQNGESLFFLNGRGCGGWEEGDSGHEINIGGGYRRMLSENWILGGYGYFDRIESLYDNSFSQGTLGIEAMSLDWDVRFNGYLAENTDKSASGAGGSVQLVNTQLLMTNGMEQAMSGFDGELGWRIPFAPESPLGDTRIYAGGFYFTASDVMDIGGPRARFETRIHDIPFLWEGSRITLSGEYRWDDVRDSAVTGMIGLRIPFGAPSRQTKLTYVERRMTDRVVRDVNIVTNVGQGAPEPVLSPTGVLIGDTYFFNRDGGGDGSFSTPFDLPTAIGAGAENALLIGLDSTGDLTGISETLLDGQTLLGGGQALQVRGANSGTLGIYTPPGAPATFSGGGAPTLTLALDNTIAGLTFFGVSEALRIDHTSGASSISILDNRFESVGTSVAASISGTFDMALNLERNVFDGGGSALVSDLSPDGSSGPSSFELVVNGNTLEGLGTALDVGVDFSGAEDYSHRSTISDNQFTENSTDYELAFSGESPTGAVDVAISLVSNMSTGAEGSFANVYVDSIPSGRIDLEISDNEIDDTGSDAIAIRVVEGPDINATISDNRITTVGGDAVHVSVYASGDVYGHLLEISGNEIQYVDDDGIDVYFGYGHDADVTISNNTIRNVGDDGIYFYSSYNGHDVGNSLTISGNTVQYAKGDGIDVDFGYGYYYYEYEYEYGYAYRSGFTASGVALSYGGYDADVTITDNTIRDVSGDGISVSSYDAGHDVGNSLTISENTIEGIGGNGIDVYFGYGYDATIDIADNTIRDVGGDGIHFYQYYNGHDVGNSLTINDNTIEDVSGDGIYIYSYYYNYDTDIVIADNTIRGAGHDGIYVYSYYYNGHDVGNSLEITGNTISEVEGSGIDVGFYYDYFDTNVTVADNTISDVYGGDGINVYMYGVGHDLGSSLTVSGNTVTDVDEDGIDLYVYNYHGDATVTIADNEIDVSGTYGIYVYADGASELTSDLDGSILDNGVTNSGDSDASLNGDFTGSIRVNGVDLP